MPDVPKTDIVKYGEYLAGPVGHCMDCHTTYVMGQIDMAQLGRGGNVYARPFIYDWAAVSANITSHPEAGLGSWTDAEIKRAITEGISRDGRTLLPFMPYWLYKKMEPSDLDAVVAYLRSLPPLGPAARGRRVALLSANLRRGTPGAAPFLVQATRPASAVAEQPSRLDRRRHLGRHHRLPLAAVAPDLAEHVVRMDVEISVIDVGELHDTAPLDQVAVQLAQLRRHVERVDRDELVRPRLPVRVDEQLQVVLEQPAEAFEDAAVELVVARPRRACR